MPIANIIDGRQAKHRYRRINAVVEATWHDNTCPDADQMPRVVGNDGPDYEEMENVPLWEAISWPMTFRSPVTLYLYDQGKGITPHP